MPSEHDQVNKWLDRLNCLGVTRTNFDHHREELSRQFGFTASVNDTVWRILNTLVIKYARDSHLLEQIYREMAALVSQEGKDPSPYLEQAEGVRRGPAQPAATERNWIFLGHDELAYVRILRKDGKLQEALDFLMKGEPSAAVLDEIRKTHSAMAKVAKNAGDWKGVVHHLEAYLDYAKKMRDYCVGMVNQEPPDHTAADQKLLAEAREKAG